MNIPKPDACKECPLYDKPGPTPAQGDHQTAKLIFITDKPSERDAETQNILSDGSGNIFNRWLYDAGIRRSECLVTPLVKCHCPEGKFKEAAKHCQRFVNREIERSPNATIVLGGQLVFDHFIGTWSSLLPTYRPTNNVYRRMGCVEVKNGRKYIGTLHARDYMRMIMIKDEAVEHLKKAYRLCGVKLPAITIHKDPSDEQLMEYARFIRDHVKEFADDVETHQTENIDEDDFVGGDYEVDMSGVSVGPWAAAVFKPSQLMLISDLYRDESLTNFQWNGPYDQFHVARIIGYDNVYREPNNRWNNWMDGMLAAHYHKSYKFKYLKPDGVSRYTDLPYYDRKIEKVDRKFYNGLDIIATHQACIYLRHKLKEMGCWDAFSEIGMPNLLISEEQRIIGCRVDIRKAYTFMKVLEAKMSRSLDLAIKLSGGLDPMNPHNLKYLCYEFWKMPVQYSDKVVEITDEDGITKRKQRKKIISTDYESRKRLIAWIDKQVVSPTVSEDRRQELLRAKSALTLVSYYKGEKKKREYLDRISPDGRIHSYYKNHGTWSYRKSSTPNLQNFPTYDLADWGGARAGNRGVQFDPVGFERQELGSLRSLIIADDDEDLILSCDFEQIQIWIYAWLSQSKWLLDIYHSGDYIYGNIYEQLYHQSFFNPTGPRIKRNKSKVVTEQEIRRTKAVPLGFLFGRSADSVEQEYAMPKGEGHELRRWWFAKNPELLTHYTNTEYEVKTKHCIKYPYGTTIWFPDPESQREAINSHAQHNEAMIVQESECLIDREFKRRGWHHKNNHRTRLMLSVHDSITMNIHRGKTNPQHVVEVYEEVVGPILSRPIKPLGDFIFRHSAEVSFMWDWKVKDYYDWKAEVFGAENDRPNQLNHPAA